MSQMRRVAVRGGRVWHFTTETAAAPWLVERTLCGREVSYDGRRLFTKRECCECVALAEKQEAVPDCRKEE